MDGNVSGTHYDNGGILLFAAAATAFKSESPRIRVAVSKV